VPRGRAKSACFLFHRISHGLRRTGLVISKVSGPLPSLCLHIWRQRRRAGARGALLAQTQTCAIATRSGLTLARPRRSCSSTTADGRRQRRRHRQRRRRGSCSAYLSSMAATPLCGETISRRRYESGRWALLHRCLFRRTSSGDGAATCSACLVTESRAAGNEYRRHGRRQAELRYRRRFPVGGGRRRGARYCK